MPQQYTILFGHLNSDTLEVVWDDCGTGTYAAREDAEWFAGHLRKEGELYKIEFSA